MNNKHLVVSICFSAAVAILLSLGIENLSSRLSVIEKEVSVEHTSSPPSSITFAQQLNTNALINGIMSGYLACERGIPLSNYIADVEAEWNRRFKEQVK